ncbi:MAG: J domain-containing protein, partial [Nostoc sp.]
MRDRFDINYAYEILGLEPGASPAQVKRAYRKLVKIWHPDR